MCGIAGILRPGAPSVAESEIRRMIDAVAHRGPDGDGIFRRDAVALGHRRLAIIDLEGGHQPLANEDEQVWITYNGELYNYRELAAELVRLGHVFRTHSDTEVIVHAYEEWGPECVRRFRGMFAYCIADFRLRRLVLARDHFGIKPLYYRIGHDYLAFASELSALRAVDDVAPSGNLQSIDYYLRFQYDPSPGTIYRDILKLPPATTMTVEFDGTRSEPVSYWDLSFNAREGLTDAQWEEHAEEVIRESVEAHLVADVPFGVFLSGGIDSTLVAGEMSRVMKDRVRAFGIGFDEERFSELPYARSAAERLGVDLVTDVVTEKDALAILPDLVEHYGQPFGDSSAIPTWFVSRLARAHVPMVLSGDGGDEAFGGYHSYVSWLETATFSGALRRYDRSTPRAAAHALVRATRRYLNNARRYDLDEWQSQIIYIGGRGRRELWRPELQHVVDRQHESYTDVVRVAGTFDRLAYAQYIDYRTYLPNDILTKVDVASMYHGLEVRTPLIDLRIVELAASLPMNQRMRRNGDRRLIAKSLPKRVVERTFPVDFSQRKKMGFAMPRAVWFLPGRPGRRLLEEVLRDRASRLEEIFERAAIERNLALHSESFDNSGPLWLLLVLGLWMSAHPEVTFA